MSQSYVRKQMVNAVAYTIELWMHLGGLLSTQEATIIRTRLSPRVTLTLLSCLATSLVHTLNSARYGVYHLLNRIFILGKTR